MKVILQKDIMNLGDAGDIKDVSDGYARNFLIPRKLVIPARGNSVKAAEHTKKLMTLRIERRNKEMAEIAQKINALPASEISVRVGAKNKLFGSVTAAHISQALQNAGFSIDKRKIEIGDSIRSLGNYSVKIRLAEKINASFNINVVADANFPVEEEEEVQTPVPAAEDSSAEPETDESSAQPGE